MKHRSVGALVAVGGAGAWGYGLAMV